MTGKAPLGPFQIRRDGQRWLRSKPSSNLRRPSPNLTPRRRLSFKRTSKPKPLFTISEDNANSLKSDSTVSLRLNSAELYSPCMMSEYPDHLIYFYPSQQLQNYQSVSFHRADEACDPTVFRTQSQWRAPSHPSHETGQSTMTIANTPCDFDYEDPTSQDPTEPDLPREAIADLFHRVEQYEREHPEVVRDSGTVWVRVNSVGRGLTSRLKTMNWRAKRPSFEARLGYSVPVQSRMRVYEKPSRLKRMEIAVHDSWRRFRNRSTGRDTELWTRKVGEEYPYAFTDTAMFPPVSNGSGPGRPRVGSRRLKRGNGIDGAAGSLRGTKRVRRDSKMFGGEESKRRKSSLFLDVYPSDFVIGSLHG